MLGYLLAVLVGAGSAGLYLAAFLSPEIHRKPDFIWGGVGLFYALVLWTYSPQMTGGILVGQAASVALLGWFGWQTVKLRQLVPIDWQTSLPITKTPERSNTQPANLAPAKPAAAKQSSGSQTSMSRSMPAVAAESRPTPPTIEPKSRPATPAAKSSPKPTTSNESVRVDVVTTAPAKPPITRIIPDPAIEQDEEAWIRLEVKPSPDASTLIKEVTRSARGSALPSQPQPIPETTQPPLPLKPQPSQAATQPPPASVKPQPDRSASGDAMQTARSAPPPPAKPQSLLEQSPIGQTQPESSPAVVKATIPTPVQPSQLTPPPALLAAAKPTPAQIAPTLTPEHPQPPQTTPNPPQNIPAAQTGDLDRLIAELESEI